MANIIVTEQTIKRMDKKLLQQWVVAQNKLMGFVPDPEATAQKARDLMVRQGVRPEDNLGSCGVVSAREE